jgi:hypothetical protein
MLVPPSPYSFFFLSTYYHLFVSTVIVFSSIGVRNERAYAQNNPKLWQIGYSKAGAEPRCNCNQ